MDASQQFLRVNQRPLTEATSECLPRQTCRGLSFLLGLDQIGAMIILLGNAGLGQSTMARRIIGDEPISRLSLDEIACDDGPKRKRLGVSLRMLHAFIQSKSSGL
jgi:hypothetical protein